MYLSSGADEIVNGCHSNLDTIGSCVETQHTSFKDDRRSHAPTRSNTATSRTRTHTDKEVLARNGAEAGGLGDLHVCDTASQRDCLDDFEIGGLEPELAIDALARVHKPSKQAILERKAGQIESKRAARGRV